MGRDQAELPENSMSPNGTDAPAADDLLAQLAGEDIDRMLAEAEVEASTTPDPGSGAIDDKELTASLDELRKEMDAGEGSAQDVPANVPTGASAPNSDAIDNKELTESLDALLLMRQATPPAQNAPVADAERPPASQSNSSTSDDNELTASLDAMLTEAGARDAAARDANAVNADDAAASAPTPGKPEDVIALDQAATSIDGILDEIENSNSQPSLSAAPANSAIAADTDQPSTASSEVLTTNEVRSERKAGSTIVAKSETAAASPVSSPAARAVPSAAAEASKAHTEPSDDDSVPLYIRVLEILNSPLDALPDFIREAMGKIALVTLLNAIVVIGYVLLFRKK